MDGPDSYLTNSTEYLSTYLGMRSEDFRVGCGCTRAYFGFRVTWGEVEYITH